MSKHTGHSLPLVSSALVIPTLLPVVLDEPVRREGCCPVFLLTSPSSEKLSPPEYSKSSSFSFVLLLRFGLFGDEYEAGLLTGEEFGLAEASLLTSSFESVAVNWARTAFAWSAVSLIGSSLAPHPIEISNQYVYQKVGRYTN